MDEATIIAIVLGAGGLIVSIISLISSQKSARWQQNFEEEKQRKSDIKEIDDLMNNTAKLKARDDVKEGYKRFKQGQRNVWDTPPYRDSIISVTDDFAHIGHRLKDASKRTLDEILENHASTIIRVWEETEDYRKYDSKKYRSFEKLKDKAKQYEAGRRTGI